jgi:fatty acid desaturase
MSGKSIRRKFLNEFSRLERDSSVTAGFIVAGYVLQILAAIGVGRLILSGGASVMELAGLAVIALFIGTRFRGLNNIVHECSHFTFCRERRHNVTFGRLCAALILGSYGDYRDEHMTHHAHLGDTEKDGDLRGIRDLRLDQPLTWKVIFRHVLTALSGAHLPYYFKPNLSARDGERYRILKLTLIAAASAFLILDPLSALVLLWLPFVWAFSAINYWTDCVDHGGLLDSGDELKASRNLPLPKYLRAIFFPRNDCYHLVHHLFPQVPAAHLHACHERLLADPVYRVHATDPKLPITSREPRRLARLPELAKSSR